MCTGNHPSPTPTDRSYYPTLDDIRNHVSKPKRATELSVIDQENAVKKIAQRSELSPSSHYFFRPYKETNLTMESPSDSNVQSCDNSQESLLWEHQESWQHQLMLKYGNIISLMDVTYKTTQYDLGSKRKHCYNCSACLCEDCGACKFCVDKPKYGGPGSNAV